MFAGDAAVLAARDAVAAQPARIEPLAHRARRDFTDFRDLPGGKHFLHGRHSLTCFAESPPRPADAGAGRGALGRPGSPPGSVGALGRARGVLARRRRAGRKKDLCASDPSASPEARNGIAERSCFSASAKDRQAPLSSMRKRPQPREVLPVSLWPVSPAARIAAPARRCPPAPEPSLRTMLTRRKIGTAPTKSGETTAPDNGERRVAVLPFRCHSKAGDKG